MHEGMGVSPLALGLRSKVTQMHEGMGVSQQVLS